MQSGWTGTPGGRIASVAPPDSAAGWRRLRPSTLVDQVIEEIIAAAARGVVLPGDRIVETEVAERLGISRVPVREALRLLESQGVVVSEPYKGIRLTPVTPERIDHLIEARIALETAAATRAVRDGRNGPAEAAILAGCIAELELMAARQDAYGLGNADTGFHRALLQIGGNGVVAELWETLSRQLTIIFGLSTLHKPMAAIVEEHRVLLRAFHVGDIPALAAEIEDHIRVQTRAVDFDTIIARRRREREEP